MWAIILIVIVVLLAIWWFMTQNQKPAEPAKTGLLSAPIEYALDATPAPGRRAARLNSVASWGWGARFWRWLRAPLRGAAARSQVGVVCVIALSAIAAGCSSRPYGTLVVGPSAPDASQVDLLVATTRAPVLEPPGVMFGGSRGRGLDFADIVVSIPPAGARQPGDVTLPSSLPANPERDFAILRADRMDLAQAKANFDARIRRTPGRRVLIFVHGFNTRFEEAVYRFAQIVHDARVDVAPVLFTWPSGGNVTDYVYDRDSAVYSRDALGGGAAGAGQRPKRRLDIHPRPFDGQLPRDRVAEADVDPRSRTLAQDPRRDAGFAGHRRRRFPPPDRRNRRRAAAGAVHSVHFARRSGAWACRASSPAIRRASARSIPSKEPYRSILEQGRVQVVDLTGMASSDFTNHGKFASGEVVGAIGQRLAEGQSLTDAKGGLVESLGTFTSGAINVAAGVATGAVAAPGEVLDPTKREKSVDTAAQATSLSQ